MGEIQCKDCIHYKLAEHVAKAHKMGLALDVNFNDCELEDRFTQGGQPLVKDLPYGECDKFKEATE